MFHPTLKLSEMAKTYSRTGVYFNIVQIGAGGNGGYLVQRLSKLLYALSQKGGFRFSYKIVDGDRVEPSNLLRQPFIEQDLFQPKAQALAERYENAYGIPIFYKNAFVETVEDIENLFLTEQAQFSIHIPVLIGCVDNNATRQLMHGAFKSMGTMIYLDSGIDAVDQEGSLDSGYSGQVVCGAKIHTSEYLSPVGDVYPNILEDKDSRLPTQACGENVVYYPQRMQTNEMAALVMNGYLNTLLSDHEIISHYTNFNARTNVMRPVYLERGQVVL